MTSNFIEIDNLALSPIDVDAWMKKKRNGEGFSPLFACEVLEKTNHYANLKFVLKEIFNQPEEEWFLYKSFVLGAIERRAHTDSVYDGLHKLASKGGYLKEFHAADSLNKVYFPKTCRVFYPDYVAGKTLTDCDETYDTIFITPNASDISFDDYSYWGYRTLSLEKENVLPKYCYINQFYDVVFDGCDLSNVEDISVSSSIEELRFENIELNEACLKLIKSNSKIRIYDCDFKNIRDKRLECSKEARIDLDCSKNLPYVMDFSDCSSFDGGATSYEGVKEVIWRKCNHVSLSDAANMPEKVCLKDCSRVKFSECDFKNIKEFDIDNVGDIRFDKIDNFDGCKIDFSKAASVQIRDCVYNRGGVKFAEGSSVDLNNVYFPSGVDLSDCEYLYVKDVSNAFSGPKLNCKKMYIDKCVTFPEVLDLSNVSCFEARACYFKDVKEIKFKKNAKICFNCCYEMPELLDFSKVDSVKLMGCEYDKVKKIVFKNAAQLRTCIKNGFDYKAVKDKVEIAEKGMFDRLLNSVSGM